MEYFTNLKVRKYLYKIYTKNLNSENIFHIVLCTLRLFIYFDITFLFMLLSGVIHQDTDYTQKKHLTNKYSNLVGMRILPNNVF